MSDATQMLLAIGNGDRKAAARLFPLVYKELRRLAKSQMARERDNHTLQATALVHEAFLRLVGNEPNKWKNSRHFYGAAAEAMRRILVDHARKKQANRHGGGKTHIQVNDEVTLLSATGASSEELLALNQALDGLAREYPDKAELVKLRYFAGMGFEEAALAMGISRATAHRHWAFARAWLFNAMQSGGHTRPASKESAAGASPLSVNRVPSKDHRILKQF